MCLKIWDFPIQEERLAKAHLAFVINDLITERDLRQGKAAKFWA